MNVALAVPSLPRPGPPMPADLLDAVPETAALGVSEIGAVFRLCRVFWLGAARPLPANDTALMTLSGCNARVWFHIRKPVTEAWRALEPVAAAVYAKAEQKRLTISAVRRLANAASRAKREANNATLAPEIKLSDQAASGLLSPAKKFDSTVNTFDVNGTAIPRRVQRSTGSPRLTERA